MDKRIVVLMSTYNGEKYLAEQLNSILNQTVPVEVVVRDDGSTDGTLDILAQYAKEHTNVSYTAEKNVGVIASFFELIKNAPEADYYALSDQDDVWMAKKVERAVTLIAQQENIDESSVSLPILYCSNTILVDENLETIEVENRGARPSFGNALVESICTGCTSVMNSAMREIVKAHLCDAKRIVMHDWWMYLLAETYGKTIFDDEALINYRQHGNNVWGTQTSKMELLKYRLSQLFAKRGYIYEQLGEYKKSISDTDLEAGKREQLDLVLASKNSFGKRVKLSKDKSIYRSTADTDRVYRVAVLMGKL